MNVGISNGWTHISMSTIRSQEGQSKQINHVCNVIRQITHVYHDVIRSKLKIPPLDKRVQFDVICHICHVYQSSITNQ